MNGNEIEQQIIILLRWHYTPFYYFLNYVGRAFIHGRCFIYYAIKNIVISTWCGLISIAIYIYFPLSRLIIECKNGISENIETKSKSHKQWDITEGPERRADVLVRNK